MTASPARGTGLGTSSTAMRSLPLKTTAFIVCMTTSRTSSLRSRRCLRSLRRLGKLDLRRLGLDAGRHREADLENAVGKNSGDIAHLDAFRQRHAAIEPAVLALAPEPVLPGFLGFPFPLARQNQVALPDFHRDVFLRHPRQVYARHEPIVAFEDVDPRRPRRD